MNAPIKTPPPEFEAWYQVEYPRLVATMVFAAGATEIGRDVAAEACSRALEEWDVVSAMRSPSGWTYALATTLIEGAAKRRRRRADLWRVVDAPPVVIPDHSIDLWNAVRALPPPERAAIALRDLGGRGEAEIGLALGVSADEVAALVARARSVVATRLGLSFEGGPNDV
jgi:RNA polymerase sigma-70 factor (ECF subfamily)